MASMVVDDDVIVESSSSGPATPMAMSNPETPRSFLEPETRNTPPPSRPHSSSLHQNNVYVAASQSKYSQLLGVIEEMGKDVRPTYSGNKTSSERLKRNIMHARILIRECLMECERVARSWARVFHAFFYYRIFLIWICIDVYRNYRCYMYVWSEFASIITTS